MASSAEVHISQPSQVLVAASVDSPPRPSSNLLAPRPSQLPESTRSLAQPLPPSWSKSRQTAVDETAKQTALKDASQRMDDIDRKTVTLVLYYKVRRSVGIMILVCCFKLTIVYYM